ncbi:phosphopantetheine-binding protein [Breoghania sp.]|uniref:acyl carrier protein n=1 Tax=Breoghania sp. TaxID=2065378 RepID=UPI00263749DF|nr:phosphopantetheine-binding protein [Breoghania sp.]MDJ0933520.1 phosphopantetheine-binding protein [Breoghania sp.]
MLGLATELGADSLVFIELRYQCEDMFGVKVSDDNFTPENFRNCNALADFVMKRLCMQVVS